MKHHLVAFSVAMLSCMSLSAPGHSGVPSTDPTGTILIEESISASATEIVATCVTWCAYPCNRLLGLRKNGVPVNLTISSTTTNTPHPFHVDTAYTIDLTPLDLQQGDVLEWSFSFAATVGTYRDVYHTVSSTTCVE